MDLRRWGSPARLRSPDRVCAGRRAAPSGRFGVNESWTTNPYFGTSGIFFADVTGDGKADAIVVNEDESTPVVVRRSTGSQFSPNENWNIPDSDPRHFADANGDGRADAILVDSNEITVFPSTGIGFVAVNWTVKALTGSKGTFFADVTGDRRADAIVVNDDRLAVRRSTTPSKFAGIEAWTTNPYFGRRAPSSPTWTATGRPTRSRSTWARSPCAGRRASSSPGPRAGIPYRARPLLRVKRHVLRRRHGRPEGRRDRGPQGQGHGAPVDGLQVRRERKLDEEPLLRVERHVLRRRHGRQEGRRDRRQRRQDHGAARYPTLTKGTGSRWGVRVAPGGPS